MSKICVGLVLFISFISSSVDCSEDMRNYPPYYAINLGGEAGQRLFLRAQGCISPYFIHWAEDNTKTILWLENGVWRIDSDCKENKKEVKGCDGDQLFKQNRTPEHLLPRPEGWIDVQNNNTEVTLDMVHLETCTTYKNILVTIAVDIGYSQ